MTVQIPMGPLHKRDYDRPVEPDTYGKTSVAFPPPPTLYPSAPTGYGSAYGSAVPAQVYPTGAYGSVPTAGTPHDFYT